MARRSRLREMMRTPTPEESWIKFVLGTAVGSFVVLSCSVGLATRTTDCVRVLVWPSIAIGVLYVVISLAGCCLCCDPGRLIFVYFAGMFFVLLALLASVVFGLVAVGGIDATAIEVREYNLSDYSGWLRGRVADPQYWATISACLRGKNACHGMDDLVQDPKTGIFVPRPAWYGKMWTSDDDLTISPVQSGCCKPPSSCGFTYVNGTTWTPTPPGAPATGTDVDCSRWSNDQQALCFQCDSCKAGVLDDIKKDWSLVAFKFTIVLILQACICACQRSLVPQLQGREASARPLLA
ncbi:hypothetical protein ACP70R_031709 [Stipagrostis hirtigluma subsp. patula]